MRISKELAEGTVALQRSFISHMTHELRTPLNVRIIFSNGDWKTPETAPQPPTTFVYRDAYLSRLLATPQAVIAFNSLCLEGGNLTPTDREYLRSSLTSGQQLLGVINQILEVRGFTYALLYVAASCRLARSAAVFCIRWL